MALFGIFVALLGVRRYSVTDRGLREGRVATLSSLTGYVVSIFVAVVGALVAFALLLFP
jgi:uncharacterized membrane protein YidH (DUF202 family)